MSSSSITKNLPHQFYGTSNSANNMNENKNGNRDTTNAENKTPPPAKKHYYSYGNDILLTLASRSESTEKEKAFFKALNLKDLNLIKDLIKINLDENKIEMFTKFLQSKPNLKKDIANHIQLNIQLILENNPTNGKNAVEEFFDATITQHQIVIAEHESATASTNGYVQLADTDTDTD